MHVRSLLFLKLLLPTEETHFPCDTAEKLGKFCFIIL